MWFIVSEYSYNIQNTCLFPGLDFSGEIKKNKRFIYTPYFCHLDLMIKIILSIHWLESFNICGVYGKFVWKN